MKLSRAERLILVNQYKILSAINNSDDFENQLEVLRYGFEREYKNLDPYITDLQMHPVSERVCHEVIEIFTMHRAISSVTGNDEFGGFDGNYESDQHSYADYIKRQGSYTELDITKNSHMPMLDTYRRQLSIWKNCQNQYAPTHQEIAEILVG